MSSECGAVAADGGERRDPSEKQEPHTVMWGKTGIFGDTIFSQMDMLPVLVSSVGAYHVVEYVKYV